MKELDRDSWHWRLATVYGLMTDFTYRDQTIDVCKYVWMVMSGILMVLIAIAAGGLLFAVPVGDALGWVAAMISMQQVIPPSELARVTVAVIITGALMGVGGLVGFGILSWNDNRKLRALAAQSPTVPVPNKQSGVLALWFKGIREKTCFTFVVKKKEA